MPTMPQQFRPRGAPTRREQVKAYDDRRGSAKSRGYGRPWAKAREGHLRNSPLCRYCPLQEDGRVTAANTVDHLYPHGGDTTLFWKRDYWVSCCGPCHSKFKQQVERQGHPAIDRLAQALGLPALA